MNYIVNINITSWEKENNCEEIRDNPREQIENHQASPELGPYLICRTCREESPTRSNKRCSSCKMPLFDSPPFRSSISVQNSHVTYWNISKMKTEPTSCLRDQIITIINRWQYNHGSLTRKRIFKCQLKGKQG